MPGRPETPEAGALEAAGGVDGAPGPRGKPGTATAAPSLEGLSRTLQRGAAISAVVLVVTQVVSFAQTLAVARLLSPAEVGVFTAGTVLANFLTEFSEGGLKNALIQREEDVEDAADTVFWATLVNGILVALVALVAAPLVGALFGSELAGVIAAVTSGVLVLHGLTNVPEGLMQRQFNFKRRVIVDPATALSFATVAVVFCVLGYGVWALVIGLYTSQLTTVTLLWILAKWRPGRGRPSIRLWRELAKVAYPLVVAGIGTKVRELVESAMVGRWLGEGPLGMYRYGRRVAVLPGMAILQVASYVLLPAFSRIASDPVRMRRGFLRATTVLWVATVPAAALLAVVGEPLIVVLLGEKWRGAGLVLVGMAGYGPGMALTAVGTEALTGAGRSRRLNWVTGVSVVVGLGSLAALIPFGLFGVGLAVSLEGLVAGGVCLALALPLASVPGREALRLLAGPVMAALLAAGATAPLEHLVFLSDQRPIPVGIGLLLVDGLVFVGVFFAALRMLAPGSAAELTGAVARLARTARRRRGSDATTSEPEAAPDGDDPADAPPPEDGEAMTRRFAASDDAVSTTPLWDLQTASTRRMPATRLARRVVPLRVVPRARPPRRNPPRRG